MINRSSEHLAVRTCLKAIAIGLLGMMLACGTYAQTKETAPGSTPEQALNQVTSQSVATDHPMAQARNPRYKISKEDIIDLVFPLTPEFNQEVTVHPDGYIQLNSVGDIYVAGKTVPELTELIRQQYTKILHDPVINVLLKDFQKPYFVAGGEIGHPGKYELRDDVTMTQAIAIAGGFTQNSKHSQVLLFRRVSNDWEEVKVLNVKKMFQAGNLSEDVHLQPGDMFFVPQNRISKVKPWIPYSMGVNATSF
jgi:polysaccharide export outer membrane protein